jgi:hypothetical protein
MVLVQDLAHKARDDVETRLLGNAFALNLGGE